MHTSHFLGLLRSNFLCGADLANQGQKSETKEVERPPIDEVLSLYDMEVVAHAVMKSSSWGYYFTGERDEYTKTGNVLVREGRQRPQHIVQAPCCSRCQPCLDCMRRAATLLPVLPVLKHPGAADDVHPDLRAQFAGFPADQAGAARDGGCVGREHLHLAARL